MKLIKFDMYSKFLSALLGSASLVSCMPSDVATPIPAAASSDSGASSATVAPVVPPITYTGFTGITAVTTTGAQRVFITWTAATDANVVAYNIYDTSSLFYPKFLKTVNVGANTATVTGLTTDNLYKFRVHAANAANLEDTGIIDLPGIPYAGATTATVLSSSSASIAYIDGSNADAINIYCTTPATTPVYAHMMTVAGVIATSATLTGLVGGTQYTCKVALTMGGFEDNNTTTVVFTPTGTASQLTYATQPGNSVAGALFTAQPVINIMDANGNMVTAGPDASAVVTLSISAASTTAGGTLLPTAPKTLAMAAVRGVASFTGINMQNAGTFVLTAKKADTTAFTNGSALLSLDSSAFAVAAGPIAANLTTITATAVTPYVAPLVADGIATYAVTIVLSDTFGNLIAGVKPSFTSTQGSATLTQPTTNTGANGIAAGSLASTASGVQTLSVVATPLGAGAVSAVVTFVAGNAKKLAFVVSPLTSAAGA